MPERPLRCECGNDTFIDVRRIVTSGKTVTFKDGLACEKCGKEPDV